MKSLSSAIYAAYGSGQLFAASGAVDVLQYLHWVLVVGCDLLHKLI
jgi:hypothetical protein